MHGLASLIRPREQFTEYKYTSGPTFEISTHSEKKKKISVSAKATRISHTKCHAHTRSSVIGQVCWCCCYVLFCRMKSPPCVDGFRCFADNFWRLRPPHSMWVWRIHIIPSLPLSEDERRIETSSRQMLSTTLMTIVSQHMRVRLKEMNL